MNTNPNPHPSPPPKNKAPPGRDGSIAPGSSHTMREPIYSDSSRLPAGAAGLPPPHRFDRFIDGFRRDPNQRVAPKDPFEYMPAGEAGAGAGAGAGLGPAAFHRTAAHGTSAPYDVRWANLQTSRSHLARRLKGRHLQMIAIGGSIGTFALWSRPGASSTQHPSATQRG